MKKLILFLLLSVASYGQVSTGNEQFSDYGFRSDPSALQIPATVNYLGTYGTDGTSGRITPLDVTIPYIPINYSILTQTLGGQLAGIDAKLGTVTDTLNTLNTGKENLFTSSNVIPKGSVTGLVNSSITDSGTGSTGIVNVNNFIGGAVTRVLPSGVTSIGQTFNLTGADNTSSLVNRSTMTYNEDTFNSPTQVGFDRRIIVNKTTNQTNAFTNSTFLASQMGTGTIGSLVGVISFMGGTGTGLVSNVSLYDSNSNPILNTYGVTNFIGFNLRNSPQNSVVNSTGIFIGELFGSTVSRAIDTNVSAGTGKFNGYFQGTADNYFKGALLVDAVTNGVDKVRINGTVLSTGYKVAGTVGLLKSDGTVDTSTHVTGSASNGQVSFWSGASSQAGDSALSWDNTGKRLSIGTNAFGTKLDVLSTSAGALIDNMTLINNSLTAGTEVGLFFSPSNATGNVRGARISAVNDGSNGVSLKFWTGQAVAPITRMTIDPIGNIGINVTPTSTATDKLQVSGNITASAATTANHVVIKSQLDLKANIASPTFTTGITTPAVNVSGQTASTIALFDASKNIVSASTATYPSLTELGYVKGVTGAINTTYATLLSPTFTGDPKVPTPTAGDNDTSIPTTAFVTGAIATSKPYKSYEAIMTQSGTSAPTVTVLENSLGFTPTYTYSSVGIYQINGTFNTLKSTVSAQARLGVLGASVNATNQITLTSYNSLGVFTDGLIVNQKIEIRIYP